MKIQFKAMSEEYSEMLEDIWAGIIVRQQRNNHLYLSRHH